jgi:hypothetical protein
MPGLARVWAVAACLVTAAALYVTRGVLDQIVVDGAALRVALLPPWESFVGFLACGVVALVVLHRFARPRGTGARGVPVGRLVLPTLALSALIIPYLPLAPDRWPVLQVLAGPLGALVWLVVAGLLGWTLWQHRLLTVPWLSRLSVPQAAAAIAVATTVVSGAAALRLTGTVLFPAGDEPHYLIIAQSLWRDRDFRIENNHLRGDYLEYFPQTLEPHYLRRGVDNEIYSIHPVGLPMLLAPVYAAGGYRLVVWVMIAMAAFAAALAWRWIVGLLNAPGAATFAWAVVATSAPFLLNTFTVYPEIAAGVAVMVGLTTRHPVVIGTAAATLPWLSTKYAPMSLVLLLVTGRPLWTRSAWTSSELLGRAVPYGVSLLAWFAFFYVFWGTPRPQAPYGHMAQTTPWNLVFGGPGLLFDQEYGLLAYAPAYILAITGLWALWRSGGDRRVAAVQVGLLFAALLGTVGAFRIWWGGSASPSRPLASGLLPLALPIAAAFAAAPPGTARRAAQHLLLWVGAGIALTMTFAQEGLLIANGRDGTSSLLEWWSPRWEIWTLAPSFIHYEAPVALAHSAAWLVVAGLAALALARVRLPDAGGAALVACAVFGAALLSVAAIVPRLPSDPPLPRANLQARSRLPALDAYDTRARPAAVVFDPLRKVAAVDVLGALRLAVEPGLRTDQQPLRVLHNGRFSLPAGSYVAEVRFAPSSLATAQFGLQLGRTGSPADIWTVEPPAGLWSTHFALPADVGFVGFRGSLDLEQAIQSITITPERIVDEGRRPRIPPVLGAGRYPAATVLFHSDQVSAEPTGFWVLGRRPITLTLAPSDPTERLALRLRSGTAGNQVTLEGRGWREQVEVDQEATASVTLPDAQRGAVTLTVTTSDGFVPMDRDPQSRDRRLLGVWIEVEAAGEEKQAERAAPPPR